MKEAATIIIDQEKSSKRIVVEDLATLLHTLRNAMIPTRNSLGDTIPRKVSVEIDGKVVDQYEVYSSYEINTDQLPQEVLGHFHHLQTRKILRPRATAQ